MNNQDLLQEFNPYNSILLLKILLNTEWCQTSRTRCTGKPRKYYFNTTEFNIIGSAFVYRIHLSLS